MRRIVGYLCFIAGGLLLSFVVGRYAEGWWRQQQAREEWNDARARAIVALAHDAVEHHRAMPVAEGAPVARLRIPRLGLDEIVLEGVDGDELNAAPGHMPGSAFPGDRGNAVISAHRDRQFDHLDALDVGDTVRTESGWHEMQWIVVSKRIVRSGAPALFATRDPTLTLTTCWPIRYLGSAPDRLIVTAKPVVRRRAAAVGRSTPDASS